MIPRYPIYVPSRGRFLTCFTAKFLIRDEIPFNLVVEPQEAEEYRSRYPDANLMILPWSNLGTGGLIAVRNWIREHAQAEGYERHWQIDDNILGMWRRWKARKIRCHSGPAFCAAEDFSDRHENIGICGFNYYMFSANKTRMPPFVRNVHVYSATLFLNSLPYRWRIHYNDDTDMCLQVLSGGWCTILINAFLIWKCQTMKIKGGNTPIYQRDGRLRMARQLERQWPGVVETKRRFQRPQHVIKYAWRRFDTPLKLKPGVVIPKEPNEYGLKLRQVKPIKSQALRDLVNGHTTD